MVQGNGKYLFVDYEKVVDVFLSQFTQEPNITREVLRSILFNDDYLPSEGVVNDLAERTPPTTAAEVLLAMLQFPLKQVENEQGDLGVLASLYNGGDNMLKLSDISETDEVKNMKIEIYRLRKLNNITIKGAVNAFLSGNSTLLDEVTNAYGQIEDWDTSEVTNMEGLFFNRPGFNWDISKWDTSKVTNMGSMFYMTTAFNQDISTKIVNQGLANEYLAWDVGQVTDMQEMFRSAIAFNQPIGQWNTGNVTNMSEMFYYGEAFNQPIGQWNVSKVENMSKMFQKAKAFNQPIGQWDTKNVTNMSKMFYYGEAFNQPIGQWNVSQVINMNGMFQSASARFSTSPPSVDNAFNQDLSKWDVRQVTDMTNMFKLADEMLNKYPELANLPNMTPPLTTDQWKVLFYSPLLQPSIVNIVSTNDGNKYVFNNGTSYDSNIYLLSNGTYTIKNIPEAHPIALLNNGESSKISYSLVNDVNSPIIIKVSGGNTSASNGDYYIFKDINDNPINIGNGTFRFMRGRTYKFEADNISLSHPFKIYMSGSFVNNGNSNEISGSSGSITITIPTNHITTSGDLYYQCSIHSGMKKSLLLLYKTVSGTTNNGSYDFYYGDVEITVNSDFEKVSVYCYHHGYMGGENLFVYNN
jgi:surface protein